MGTVKTRVLDVWMDVCLMEGWENKGRMDKCLDC